MHVRMARHDGIGCFRGDVLQNVFGQDDLFRVKLDDALNQILQLPDVALPGQGHQEVGGLVGQDHLFPTADAPGDGLDEIIGQQDDVLAPVPQGRQGQLEGAQAEEQIGAEKLLLDHVGQIRVGGGNDFDVHVDEPVAAQAHELLLFHHPEQGSLEVQLEVADFVQEDGAAVGQLKLADVAVFLGPGEGAAVVAEELAGDELPGKGAAVHGDEGLVLPPAGVVDGLGEHVLAHAAFPQDHDVAVGVGDEIGLADGRLDGAAQADDAGKGQDRGVAHLPGYLLAFQLGRRDEGDDAGGIDAGLVKGVAGHDAAHPFAPDIQGDGNLRDVAVLIEDFPELFVLFRSQQDGQGFEGQVLPGNLEGLEQGVVGVGDGGFSLGHAGVHHQEAGVFPFVKLHGRLVEVEGHGYIVTQGGDHHQVIGIFKGHGHDGGDASQGHFRFGFPGVDAVVEQVDRGKVDGEILEGRKGVLITDAGGGDVLFQTRGNGIPAHGLPGPDHALDEAAFL